MLVFFSPRSCRQLLPFFWLHLCCSWVSAVRTSEPWMRRGRRGAAAELPLAFEGNPWLCISLPWVGRWTRNSAPRVSSLSSLYSNTAVFKVENERLRANPSFLLLFICASWWYFICGFFNHLDLFFLFFFPFFVVLQPVVYPDWTGSKSWGCRLPSCRPCPSKASDPSVH